MNLQRKLTLVVATGAVALGAGHVVQKNAGTRMATETAAVAEPAAIAVSSLVPVAAGPENMGLAKPAFTPPVLPAEAAPIVAKVVPAAPPVTPAAPEAKPVAVAATPKVATTPAPVAPVAPAAPLKQLELATTPDIAQVARVPAPDCSVKLDLVPQSNAMIGVSLLAPCNPGARVVLRHAGLAVTGTTSASGALATVIPALTTDATVDVAVGNTPATSGQITVPDVAKLTRFAVQWQGADAFQLHAFENGAAYADPGHISAAYTGKPGETGILSVLGDAKAELPLLAEVYTFAKSGNAEIVLEAAVTSATCGREILGEMLVSTAGEVEVTDLSLAMPDCSGLGDILVLKNLMQDMTLAAAN